MLLVRAMVLLDPLVSGGGRVLRGILHEHTLSSRGEKTSSIDFNLKTFQNVSQSIYINLFFDSDLIICQLCYFFSPQFFSISTQLTLLIHVFISGAKCNLCALYS